MTLDEAREVIIDGIDYAAYKETDSSLHDSDKNRLYGSEFYRSGRLVVKPSPWGEGDFEEKMAMLLALANVLNRSLPAFSEAQDLLREENSVIGRVIRRTQTNDPLSSEPQDKDLPRWVQVPAGVILGLLALFCGFASFSLLLMGQKQISLLAIPVGLVLILGCLWVLEKCFRMITGRKNRGGLMTPNTLRVVAFFLLVMPIAGIFTGYYREHGAIAAFQAVMYFFGFLGLRALARKREANELPSEKDRQRPR